MISNDKAAGCCLECAIMKGNNSGALSYYRCNNSNCLCHSPTPRTEKKCEYCENGEYHEPNAVYPCSKSDSEDDAIEALTETFRKVRTDAISEMFDNAKDGIYPTSKFFGVLDDWLLYALRSYGDMREEKGRMGSKNITHKQMREIVAFNKEEGRREERERLLNQKANAHDQEVRKEVLGELERRMPKIEEERGLYAQPVRSPSHKVTRHFALKEVLDLIAEMKK